MDTTEHTSPEDLSRANSLARRYLTGRDLQGLDSAAEMLELCLSEEEEQRILWWWNEGVRDYAKDQQHIEELNQLLLDRRAALYPTAKDS